MIGGRSGVMPLREGRRGGPAAQPFYERGVRTVFVSLPDLAGPEDVLRLAPLAAAFA